MSPASTSSVCYIPPQADVVASTGTPRACDNPLLLLWRDIRTLVWRLYLLPKLFYPFSSRYPDDELSLHWKNSLYLGLLVFVTLLETLLCLVASVSATLLPGWLSTGIFVAMLGLVWGLVAPIQGPMIVESRIGVKEAEPYPHNHERWIFVNGVMGGNRGLQSSCARLSQIFGRVITGIHNPTGGLLWDVIECIFQRSFSYNTYSTRYAYDHLKRCLTDASVHKVILIGHSQGGIIVSMVLDLLFNDLPVENMAKLEVYTFACAASHFNNPLRAIRPNSPSQRSAVIQYVEHYVNEEDLVPRWGVMYNVRCSRTRYCGKVFIRNGATGHMFNQHYLSNIFPLDNPDGDPGTKCFLDQEVMVDECTCRKREAHSATAAAAAITSDNSICHDSSSSSQSDSGVEIVSAGNGNGICPDDPSNGKNGAGMTVRELSRLWRYLDGADPDAHETPMMN
ncbi:hypothetical protein PABG_01929 [Paracoccidioides brasiliensis Pb03]|nr:hypothetical protein PABG_01929 [Paracoccidioides brasiliensis Pb03]